MDSEDVWYNLLDSEDECWNLLDIGDVSEEIFILYRYEFVSVRRKRFRKFLECDLLFDVLFI